MKKIGLSTLLLIQTCLAPLTAQADAAKLAVSVSGVDNNGPIPDKFAYCVADGAGKSKDGSNINPSISWSGAPDATKSYVLMVLDQDVPASFELANKDGKTIPIDFPRQNFYHWVLVDISTLTTSVGEGKDSNGITQGGKPVGRSPGGYGLTGQNDYARVGKGQGGGYDGPCPPWNDLRLHHYHFIVYALDVRTLGLSGAVTGKQVEDAMAGHILAKGEAVGTYTTNPKLPAQPKP